MNNRINGSSARPDNPVYPTAFASIVCRAVKSIRQFHYSNGLSIHKTVERYPGVEAELLRDIVYYRRFIEETFTPNDAAAMNVQQRLRYCCDFGLLNTRLPPKGLTAMFLGIDPGASGAFAVVDEDGKPVDCVKLKETPHDIDAWLRGYTLQIVYCQIERVSAMPRQGVSSTFKFGTSFGFVQGLIVARAIPFDLVVPSRWQEAMKCKSKGDKNVTKAAAQRLFPGITITHANADAYLIAENARRTYYERAGR